jgi:hypothetical protein
VMYIHCEAQNIFAEGRLGRQYAKKEVIQKLTELSPTTEKSTDKQRKTLCEET